MEGREKGAPILDGGGGFWIEQSTHVRGGKGGRMHTAKGERRRRREVRHTKRERIEKVKAIRGEGRDNE